MEPPTIYLPEAAIEPIQRILRQMSRLADFLANFVPTCPGDEVALARAGDTVSATTHTLLRSNGFVVLGSPQNCGR